MIFGMILLLLPFITPSSPESLSERKYADWKHLEDNREQDGHGEHSCIAELIDEFGVYLDDNERKHEIISIYPQTPFLIWASTTPLNYCWIGAIPGQLCADSFIRVIFGKDGNMRPLTKILSSGLSSSVAISVSSLSLDSFEIISGNSLLFDVCSSKGGDVRNCEVLSSLASSSLRNLTSTQTGHHHTPKRLSQQSHGLTITETVGALQGTVLQDHNFGGSHLCANTSFSACQTSSRSFSDFTSSPGLSRFFSEADKQRLPSYDFVGPLSARYSFTPPATLLTPITFTDCIFTDLVDETENAYYAGEGAIQFSVSTPFLVKGCVFTNCETTKGDGGAIHVVDGFHYQGHFRIESSTFKNCSSLSGNGGGVCSMAGVDLELKSCSFESCSALTGNGGALSAGKCAVFFSTFKSNKASTNGAIASSPPFPVHFCHFEGNTA
ncbi:hypothetical protein BLNAU_13286 [Blattamonas nauphoetae]|uniref:Uncharacterized protein n=1 Tax=Blattamonas nauphoetae TaxID=2049346 RepID=A0ABQ9XH72_9EUKA|nr:hypothetical protein BLNAU_13286 [Blattamonas nauphoetae]